MGSLPTNKEGVVTMDTHKSSGSDTEKTDDLTPDSATSKVGKNIPSNNTTTVKGSENSKVTDSTVIGAAYNCTINPGEKQQEGLSCTTTEGPNPKLKISVPARDGGTLIYIDCSNAEVRDWYYRRNVNIENTCGSKLTFGNLFSGFMASIINGEFSDAFFDLIRKWEDSYDCKLHTLYKKCLVIEFQHETEEGRNKMIKEQDAVKEMFQNFMNKVQPHAPVCTLEVKEIKTPTCDPDTASKDAGQDVSLPSTYSSEEARSLDIKDEKMFDSDSFFLRLIMEDDHFALGYHLLAREAIDHGFPMLVPPSLVKMLECESCLDVRHDCEEDLSTFENVFFFHLNHHRISTFENVAKFQFRKILTALRNSNGGVLIVHWFNTSKSGDFHSFIKPIFGSILNEDVVPCEVFKTQNIRKYKYMFRIDVEPSDMFVTLDYKTKFPSLSMDKFQNASNEKVRHLLFSSRTAESTEAALRGVSSKQQNLEPLRLYSDKRYAVPPLEYDILHSLVSDMTALCVPEHVSALSKKKSGGNIYVVMPELKFDAIPLDLQKRIKDRLRQELMNKLRCQENKHSKVSLQGFGVIDIALSKDAETGACSIEIAVGHVNGCVFYDPKGPVSYKIEWDRLVRLPFEKWIEEAFE